MRKVTNPARRDGIAAALVSALVVVSPVIAGDPGGASAVGGANLTVASPVTFTQDHSLDFGTITSDGAGDVIIDPGSGARKVDGGVGAVAVRSGKPASFGISGRPNAEINVVVGSTIVGFRGGLTGQTTVGPLPAALNGASATFAVGGVLNVPPRTPAGVYSGTFTVTVNYP